MRGIGALPSYSDFGTGVSPCDAMLNPGSAKWGVVANDYVTITASGLTISFSAAASTDCGGDRPTLVAPGQVVSYYLPASSGQTLSVESCTISGVGAKITVVCQCHTCGFGGDLIYRATKEGGAACGPGDSLNVDTNTSVALPACCPCFISIILDPVPAAEMTASITLAIG